MNTQQLTDLILEKWNNLHNPTPKEFGEVVDTSCFEEGNEQEPITFIELGYLDC